jgi:hypothetical protein
MIEALEKARGLRTQAARILGCHPVTVDVYAKRYASVKQALRYEREKFIDAAEAALYSSVISKEPWAVTFTLATIGKDRGYVRREERKLQGDEENPIKYIVLEGSRGNSDRDSGTIVDIVERSALDD